MFGCSIMAAESRESSFCTGANEYCGTLLNVWRGNNVAGVLPTGYGKSVALYLIPDLMLYVEIQLN